MNGYGMFFTRMELNTMRFLSVLAAAALLIPPAAITGNWTACTIWGSKAKVLGPLELVERVAREVEGMRVENHPARH